jgi:Flp pilus assembly protein TadG
MGGRQGSSRGAAIVEAAIIMPLLLLLTFGIWTTARAWNVHNVLDHASREAARFGATTPDTTDIQTVAQGIVGSAAINWADIEFCAAIIERDPITEVSTVTESIRDGVVTNGGTQCIGDDPTSDSRVQVTILYPDYGMDFLFFTITVDMGAQGVARLERGT